MVIKQLSVFLENREGRLEKVAEALAANQINIVSLSLADTSEYGMLRMIVSDPTTGKQILKEAGFSAMLTDVLAVKLPQKIGMLYKMLAVFGKEDISVEYMYTLATGSEASIIVKVSEAQKALILLQDAGFELMLSEDAYKINCERN